MSVPHPTWLRTYTDSCARRQGPAMDRETVYFYILVSPLEFSQPRLCDWHCILQVAIGFYPSARNGLQGYCRRLPGRRAGVTSHRYRSRERSSYRIAIKLGGDESWGRIWDEFVHGRHGSLIKRLTS